MPPTSARLPLPAALLAGSILALPGLTAAQAPDAPGAPGLVQPTPPGSSDNSPMIVPPPDGDVAPVPDAFGSGALPPEPDEAAPGDAEAAKTTRSERLDALFAELRRTADDEAAAEIASRIEREWTASGSATIDLLMRRAASSMAANSNAAALDLLDQVLVLDPAFAEGWNRRATLHFAMDAYGKSLADIEQTLRREPRHFGALMGLGLILERTGRKNQALEAYLRVLSIFPTHRSAQDAAGRLADELTGPAI